LSNIAIALRAEITRLARKELRGETAKLKKASVQYRSDIAALKRRVTSLESQSPGRAIRISAAPAAGDASARIRYSAKGLGAQRRRLKLSAADMGILLGVSANTIYSWEAGNSRPRQQQVAAIAAVRGIGRREAQTKLRQLAG
jgi:DNA-binding XRE family transcriptional regulator